MVRLDPSVSVPVPTIRPAVRERWAALAKVGGRQLGCFTVEQAITAGFPSSTVSDLVARGEWRWVADHVLRPTAAGPMTWREHAVAACLSVDGVAGYRTAAALYDLGQPPRVPDVVVTRAGRGRRRPGIHTTLVLPRSDLATVASVPATAPARTLVDLGSVVRGPRLVEAVDAALLRGLVRAERLERRARELRSPGRPGAARVLAVLASRHPELERARNEWEARMLRLCRRFRLPEPAPNFVLDVGGGRVRILDLAWEAARVFAEFDGFLPHAGRTQFDDDRVRQNEVVARGWVPFRFTSTAITSDPAAAFEPLIRTLRERGVA